MVFDQGNASECLDYKFFASTPHLVHSVFVPLFCDDVHNDN